MDAELERHSLSGGGIICELERVQTRADFATALQKGGFDLILADYTLPGFDGLSALKMARKTCGEVPFIFVSSTLGEEAAIETLKSGATDYVLKQRLERLAPAVRRAIREAEERSERQRAEAALRRSEQQLRTLVEQIPAVTYTQHIAEHGSSKANPTLYASPQIEAQSGYPPQAFVETPELWTTLLHPEDRERVLAERRRANETGEPFKTEYRQIARDGRVVWLRNEAVLVRDEEGRPRFWQGVIFDITDRRRVEEEIRRSEERFRSLVLYTSDIIVVLDAEGTILYESPAVERMLGFRPEERVGTDAFSHLHPDDVGTVRSKFVELVGERGGHVAVEYRVRDKGGSWHHFEAIGVNLLHDRIIRGIVVNTRDISERRRAKEASRESLKELADLKVAIDESAIVAFTDQRGRITYVNDKFSEISGYDREELLGEDHGFIRVDYHPKEFIDDLWRTIAQGRVWRGELRNRAKDGSIYWVDTTVVPFLDESGKPYQYIAICHDNTRHEAAEEALRASEERFRATFEQAAVGVAHVGLDGRWLRVNDRLCEIVGYEREELLEKAFHQDMTHPDDLEKDLEHLQRLLAGEVGTYSMEKRYRRKDGAVVWINLTVSLVRQGSGEPKYLISVVEDISRRKQTERALKESEERFRLLAEKTSDLICLHEPDGRYVYVSPSCRRLLGYEPDELLGADPYDLFHPEDARRIRSEAHANVLEGQSAISVTYRIRKKSGEYTWFETLTEPIVDESGTVVRLQTSSRDVSDRKRAEKDIRDNEELYRTVVEQSAENILIVDCATRHVLEANAALRRSLGYTSQELKQMTLYDIAAHDRESIDRNIRRVLEQKRYAVGERKYLSKDGSLVEVEVNASVVLYRGREAMCIVAHDVTRRNRADRELRHNLSVLLALREAGQVLGSTLRSEEIVSRLLEIMRGVAGLTAAVISRPDHKRNLKIWRASGLEQLPPNIRFFPEAEKERMAVLQRQEQRLLRLRSVNNSSEDTLVALYLPLKIKDRVEGVLEAYGSESLVEGDTVEVLSSLSSQAASALENAQLYEALGERERTLQDLVGKLLGTQEEERRRVAYEVHDGLAQVAAAAHQHLQAFARRHPPEAEGGRKDLQRILKLVRGTVSDARRIIANLRPTALDDLGLAATILLEVERLREEGYQVDYEETLGEERLPEAVEIALYRITQEALTNMRKHARARHVRIELQHEDEEVCLVISDDGRGFDPAAPPLERGPGERVGLVGMQERIATLGGVLEVESRPGAGTSVTATVPLTNAA